MQRKIEGELTERKAKRSGTGVPPVCFRFAVSIRPPVVRCKIAEIGPSRFPLLLASGLRSPASGPHFLLCASVLLFSEVSAACANSSFSSSSSSSSSLCCFGCGSAALYLCGSGSRWFRGASSAFPRLAGLFYQTNPFHISLSCLFTAASVSSLPPAGPQRTQISGFGMSGFQRFRAESSLIQPNPAKISLNLPPTKPLPTEASPPARKSSIANRKCTVLPSPPKSGL